MLPSRDQWNGRRFAIADMAFQIALSQNGRQVQFREKNFTGVPRAYDELTSTYFCLYCHGTWLIKWGQLLEAPPGYVWAPTPPCQTLLDPRFLACIEQATANVA